MAQYKRFGFIRTIFFTAMKLFSCAALEYVSMNDKQCRTKTNIIDNYNNEPSFYLYSTEVNKCSGSFNNINDPYAKLCVPDVLKNINVKVFNLMLGTNETRYIEWHESRKCKCRLDASVCNNKQRWNKDNAGVYGQN